MQLRIVLTLTFVTLQAVLSGCATLGRDPGGQAIWVRSDPPGAEIEVDGRNLGTTPAYVIVPRERTPKLYLSRDGYQKKIKVETRYRWQASFFSNLVFYIFAPVGWGVDLISGRAWNPKDPDVINMRPDGDTKKYVLSPVENVAVAPPEADSLALSNAALPLLQRAIALRSKAAKPPYSVVPFESTVGRFLKRGYDFDGIGSYDDERMLYERLTSNAAGASNDGRSAGEPVDAVWSSTLESQKDGLHLDAKLTDLRTQQKIDELHIVTEPQGTLSRTYEKGRRLFGLPNSVTVSLASQQFVFERGSFGNVSLAPIQDNEWWEKGLSYLSAVSITNIPAYRPGRSGRWMFSFYPVARVSRRTLVARGAADVDGQTFSRWLLGVGYGPELGYQVERSYFYFNLFLNGAWSRLDWRYNGREESLSKASILTSTEFGYLYSFSDFWSLRLFVTTTSENADIWKEALARTSNAAIPYTGQNEAIANVTSVGLSLGFSFEPLLVRGFTVREK